MVAMQTFGNPVPLYMSYIPRIHIKVYLPRSSRNVGAAPHYAMGCL